MLAAQENPYTHMINLKKAEAGRLKEKINQNSKEIKNNLKKIVLGEDSKVDEAIVVSFLFSVFSNFNSAIDIYRKIAADKRVANLEEKEATRQRLIELKQKVNEYNQLQIEKTLEEKKLSDPNISNTDKKMSMEKLLKIAEDMKNLAEFFGYADESKLKQEIEKAEKLWYGEEVAKVLNDFRNLDDNTLSKFEDLGIINENFKEELTDINISSVLDKIRNEVSSLASEELQSFINTNLETKIDIDVEQK